MDNKKRCVLLLSGGIDSMTLAHQLVHDGYHVHALTMDYGQTLDKEVEVARKAADGLELLWRRVDIPLLWVAPACALLQGTATAMPTGRNLQQISQGGTPPTYVPFRNGIFLALAVAYGEARGIGQIFCGGNGLHSGLYWDDTAQFAQAMTLAATVGTSPAYAPVIRFPFADMDKAAIVGLGRSLGVDYGATWSCYQNGHQHCGQCDSCVQRAAALGGHL